METQQQTSQTCWVAAAALMLKQLHEGTHSARIRVSALGLPSGFKTQASFPTCDFFPPYFTSSHLYPKGEAAQSRGGHRSSIARRIWVYLALLEAKQAVPCAGHPLSNTPWPAEERRSPGSSSPRELRRLSPRWDGSA